MPTAIAQKPALVNTAMAADTSENTTGAACRMSGALPSPSAFCSNEKDELLKASLNGPLGVLAATVVPESDPVRLHEILDHIQANTRVARLLLAQPLRSRIGQVLADHIAAQLRAPGLHPGCNPLVAQLRTIALAEAQLAIIERWLFGPVALSAEAIGQELTRLARTVMTGGHQAVMP